MNMNSKHQHIQGKFPPETLTLATLQVTWPDVNMDAVVSVRHPAEGSDDTVPTTAGLFMPACVHQSGWGIVNSTIAFNVEIMCDYTDKEVSCNFS